MVVLGKCQACIIVSEVRCEQTVRRNYWCVGATSPLAFLLFECLTLQPKSCVLTTVLCASFSRLENKPPAIYMTLHSMHYCNLFPRLLSQLLFPPTPFSGSPLLCIYVVQFAYCLSSLDSLKAEEAEAPCSLLEWLGCSLLHPGVVLGKESCSLWTCSVQSESPKNVVRVGAFCQANAPAVFQRPVNWTNLSFFSLCWQKACLARKPILLPILKFGY